MVVADFFLKVHGLRWVAVCGMSGGRVVVVFRGGYGKMDLGAVASCVFPGIGGGGGHKTMARAEAALVDIPVEARSGLEEYVFQLIYKAAEKRRRSGTRSAAAADAEHPAEGRRSAAEAPKEAEIAQAADTVPSADDAGAA